MADQPIVFIIDDENHVLEAIEDSIEGDFILVTATGVTDSLEKLIGLKEDAPLAIVITDQHLKDGVGNEILSGRGRHTPK